MSLPTLMDYDKNQLESVVLAIKKALSDPKMRALSQRAVQGKIWHQETVVSEMLSKLRADEEVVRRKMMEVISKLVYRFHEHSTEATLARAGLMQHPRVHSGSSLEDNEAFDVFCLDAKERLYIILKNYGWMEDFFRSYPLHFYENSFQFVERIPDKKLDVRVKVIGLGIGGSVCVSGLAKNGIKTAKGFEKRAEKGPRSVTSRYQNASWRAYDIAAKLVDEEAFGHLMENRQRINVKYDDGTEGVVSSDRVQIIIGSAIQSALDSARRYGAELVFEANMDEYFSENGAQPEECDLVGLFCGAHTSQAFPGLAEIMNISSWPEMDSVCKMWLRITESEKSNAFCARGGEIGAEQWHYTIESARKNIVDAERVRFNQDSTYKYNLGKLEKGADIGMTKDELTQKYEAQKAKLESVIQSVKDGKTVGSRFDYIFTNAPANDHNLSKRKEVDQAVVLDGGYTVEVKIAAKNTVASGDLLEKFNTKLIACGGDAAVPPNPLAAYGATLACEAAGSFVKLAVSIGHVNAILKGMEEKKDLVDEEWVKEAGSLKDFAALYYEARSRSENYFQWVQTMICNTYSLPPFFPAE